MIIRVTFAHHHHHLSGLQGRAVGDHDDDGT